MSFPRSIAAVDVGLEFWPRAFGQLWCHIVEARLEQSAHLVREVIRNIALWRMSILVIAITWVAFAQDEIVTEFASRAIHVRWESRHIRPCYSGCGHDTTDLQPTDSRNIPAYHCLELVVNVGLPDRCWRRHCRARER